MKGGARPGAGRKPGSANRRTREIADRAAAEGITPLELMLGIMRQGTPQDADAATQLAYASLRFEAAKAAAPYIHPRLAQRDGAIRLAPLGETLTDQGRAVMSALIAGELTPDQASRVMATLAAQARIIEVSDLEQRISALERKGRE
jgi:hypothetical protein